MKVMTDGEVALRDFEDSDVSLIAEYANNEKISKNLRDIFPHPYVEEDARVFLDMVKGKEPQTFFAIEYKGMCVGSISLSLGSDVYRKSAEIGYFVGEPYWGKGIGSRAIMLMVEFGFKTFDIVRIHAGVYEYNKVSQHVLEKCGFEKEGVFRKSVYKGGKLYDEIRYSKVKEGI
ncbi:MAG: GNAT family N-acetyltransferase [Hyphomicrobiales bacterium]